MKKLLFVFGAMALLTSCKNNSTTNSGTTEPTSVISAVKEAVSNDGLKSAIYETETIMPGGIGTATSKITFDDFGKKAKTQMISAMSFGGKTMNTTANSLRVDDYVYSWQEGAKSGMKFKLDKSKLDPSNTDFSKLSDEMKKKMNYKDEGTETINGRECKVASFSSEQMSGKIWIWKQVPVKMEMSMGGKAVTSNLKSVEENPSIPSSTFDVPSGIEFKEMTMPATHETAAQ